MYDVLKRIKEVATPLLRDGIVIADVVFNPYDDPPFASKGYGLSLYRAPNRMLGVRFEQEPSEVQITKAVEMIQNILLREGAQDANL